MFHEEGFAVCVEAHTAIFFRQNGRGYFLMGRLRRLRLVMIDIMINKLSVTTV